MTKHLGEISSAFRGWGKAGRERGRPAFSYCYFGATLPGAVSGSVQVMTTGLPSLGHCVFRKQFAAYLSVPLVPNMSSF